MICFRSDIYFYAYYNMYVILIQEPVKRVLGNFHGYRQKGAKRRRVQLNDEVIEIPFLESLEQWLNNPSILEQVKTNFIHCCFNYFTSIVFKGEAKVCCDPIHSLCLILSLIMTFNI